MSEAMSGMGRTLFKKAYGDNVKPPCQLCKFSGDNYEDHTTLDCEKKRLNDALWKANLNKDKADPLSLIVPFVYKNVISGCSEDEDSVDLDHEHSSMITPDAK